MSKGTGNRLPRFGDPRCPKARHLGQPCSVGERTSQPSAPGPPAPGPDQVFWSGTNRDTRRSLNGKQGRAPAFSGRRCRRGPETGRQSFAIPGAQRPIARDRGHPFQWGNALQSPGTWATRRPCAGSNFQRLSMNPNSPESHHEQVRSYDRDYNICSVVLFCRAVAPALKSGQQGPPGKERTKDCHNYGDRCSRILTPDWPRAHH